MKIVQFLIPGLIAATIAPALDAHCHKIRRICRPQIIITQTRNHTRAIHRRPNVQPKIKTSAMPQKAMPNTRTCDRAQYHTHKAGQRGRCIKLATAMHRHMQHRCRK